MSPLVWDLAHIAAYEDLWIAQRLAGSELLHPELAAMYDAFETPRAVRGDLPLLDHVQARDYLAAVRERTDAALAGDGAGDGEIVELVICHELQHQETMLQALELVGLESVPAMARRANGHAGAGAGGATGLEQVKIPAGPATLGASNEGFAYDNERPRHTVELPAYRIGRTPISNATFLSFVEGGGYERREWWSDEGWHWKEEYDITHPGGWTGDGRRRRVDGLVPLDPHAPVVHVSWFEADAFARAHGARLPTEAEWERAATWSQGTANVDWRALEPQPPGADGELTGFVGDVWEWTSSPFGGYPGFHAHPYPEYSEVFFGPEYRVLRGGAWATSARVASATFRNWDLPIRRQIFSGLRLAWDEES